MKLEKINEQSVTLVSQLKAFPAIQKPDEYILAGTLWKSGRDMMKAIDDGYDSIITSLHKTHKEAVAKKKSFYAPVEEGVKYVKSLMERFDRQEEEKRQAEQRRLQEIANKEAEERRLQEALEAEAAGETEEAEAILVEQVHVAPVIIPKEIPKVTGGPVFQTRWDMEVVDLKELVRAVANGIVPINAILPNEIFLRQQAVSLKEAMNIPGVRAYSKRV